MFPPECSLKDLIQLTANMIDESNEATWEMVLRNEERVEKIIGKEMTNHASCNRRLIGIAALVHSQISMDNLEKFKDLPAFQCNEFFKNERHVQRHGGELRIRLLRTMVIHDREHMEIYDFANSRHPGSKVFVCTVAARDLLLHTYLNLSAFASSVLAWAGSSTATVQDIIGAVDYFASERWPKIEYPLERPFSKLNRSALATGWAMAESVMVQGIEIMHSEWRERMFGARKRIPKRHLLRGMGNEMSEEWVMQFQESLVSTLLQLCATWICGLPVVRSLANVQHVSTFLPGLERGMVSALECLVERDLGIVECETMEAFRGTIREIANKKRTQWRQEPNVRVIPKSAVDDFSSGLKTAVKHSWSLAVPIVRAERAARIVTAPRVANIRRNVATPSSSRLKPPAPSFVDQRTSSGRNTVDHPATAAVTNRSRTQTSPSNPTEEEGEDVEEDDSVTPMAPSAIEPDAIMSSVVEKPDAAVTKPIQYFAIATPSNAEEDSATAGKNTTGAKESSPLAEAVKGVDENDINVVTPRPPLAKSISSHDEAGLGAASSNATVARPHSSSAKPIEVVDKNVINVFTPESPLAQAISSLGKAGLDAASPIATVAKEIYPLAEAVKYIDKSVRNVVTPGSPLAQAISSRDKNGLDTANRNATVAKPSSSTAKPIAVAEKDISNVYKAIPNVDKNVPNIGKSIPDVATSGSEKGNAPTSSAPKQVASTPRNNIYKEIFGAPAPLSNAGMEEIERDFVEYDEDYIPGLQTEESGILIDTIDLINNDNYTYSAKAPAPATNKKKKKGKKKTKLPPRKTLQRSAKQEAVERIKASSKSVSRADVRKGSSGNETGDKITESAAQLKNGDRTTPVTSKMVQGPTEASKGQRNDPAGQKKSTALPAHDVGKNDLSSDPVVAVALRATEKTDKGSSDPPQNSTPKQRVVVMATEKEARGKNNGNIQAPPMPALSEILMAPLPSPPVPRSYTTTAASKGATAAPEDPAPATVTPVALQLGSMKATTPRQLAATPSRRHEASAPRIYEQPAVHSSPLLPFETAQPSKPAQQEADPNPAAPPSPEPSPLVQKLTLLQRSAQPTASKPVPLVSPVSRLHLPSTTEKPTEASAKPNAPNVPPSVLSQQRSSMQATTPPKFAANPYQRQAASAPRISTQLSAAPVKNAQPSSTSQKEPSLGPSQTAEDEGTQKKVQSTHKLPITGAIEPVQANSSQSNPSPATAPSQPKVTRPISKYNEIREKLRETRKIGEQRRLEKEKAATDEAAEVKKGEERRLREVSEGNVEDIGGEGNSIQLQAGLSNEVVQQEKYDMSWRSKGWSRTEMGFAIECRDFCLETITSWLPNHLLRNDSEWIVSLLGSEGYREFRSESTAVWQSRTPDASENRRDFDSRMASLTGQLSYLHTLHMRGSIGDDILEKVPFWNSNSMTDVFRALDDPEKYELSEKVAETIPAWLDKEQKEQQENDLCEIRVQVECKSREDVSFILDYVANHLCLVREDRTGNYPPASIFAYVQLNPGKIQRPDQTALLLLRFSRKATRAMNIDIANARKLYLNPLVPIAQHLRTYMFMGAAARSLPWRLVRSYCEGQHQEEPQARGRMEPEAEKYLKQLRHAGLLDESQQHALSVALDEMNGFRDNNATVSLIQGPPGTGKTHCIVAMIGALLHSPALGPRVLQAGSDGILRRGNAPIGARARRLKGPTILVVSSSNETTNIVLERIHEQGIPFFGNAEQGKVAGKYKPRMVRIGRPGYMMGNPVLQQYMFREQVAQYLDSLQVGRRDEGNARKELEERQMLANETILIFTTVATLTSRQFTELRLAVDVLIIDEAARLSSAEYLAACTCISRFSKRTNTGVHIVQVGDHLQLFNVSPGVERMKSLQRSEFARHCDPRVEIQAMSMSVFERLYLDKTCPRSMLYLQYRMHPAISGIHSKLFYRGEVRDGLDLSHFEKPYNTTAWGAVQCLDTGPYAGRGEGLLNGRRGRYYNPFEADVIFSLISRFLSEFSNVVTQKSFAVLSFYTGQVEHLKRTVGSVYHDVEISTVDGMQGKERDIVILSMVRCELSGRRDLSFISEPTRVNVACSRAKFSFIIVGDFETCANSGRDWEMYHRNCLELNTRYMELRSVFFYLLLNDRLKERHFRAERMSQHPLSRKIAESYDNFDSLIHHEFDRRDGNDWSGGRGRGRGPHQRFAMFKTLYYTP